MALRFLSLRLTPHIRRVQPQTIRSLYSPRLSGHTTALNGQWLRLLHVRVSDQEAGLQAKREANKKETDYGENIQHDQPPKEPTRRSWSSKSRPSKSAKPEEELKQDKVLDYGDPDTFGDVRFSDTPEATDAGDIVEEEYISNKTRHSKKLRTKEYAHMIKDHLNAHRVNDALNVLERRMLREDRVKPENYIYNLLISGCAKAGYARKAFDLYAKMRKRGLKVTGGTYTSLFNACAHAPTPADGLAKAQHLRETMLEKGYEPNVRNYNAMIKAYGRCGDVPTAYLLADEMLDRQLEVTAETFNFLLQACAGDAAHGFRHGLLTWHKMLQRGIAPDYYTFNALLRCVRDCGFGQLEDMQQVLEKIAPDQLSPKQLGESKTDTLPEIAGNEEAHIAIASEATELELPNLLLPRPHLGSLVALTEITRPHERFLLLGSLGGFLALMKTHKVTPDIETFTTMLEVIPPTNAAEKQLLTFVRQIGLKADIDFFNVLIKKRSMRFDYESGREVLSMIRTAGLQPDIVTYGVLALGCRNQEEARELLEQMRLAGIRLNMPILGAMLRQGCAQKSFAYVTEIMQLSLEEGLRPNEPFLRHLHSFHRGCARAIDARHPSTKTPAFKKGHSKFCDKYRLFYEEHGLTGLKLEDAVGKLKQRPYAQFKEAPVDGLEPLKHEKVKRKTKVRKYIKKIKIDQLRDDPAGSPEVKRLE